MKILKETNGLFVVEISFQHKANETLIVTKDVKDYMLRVHEPEIRNTDGVELAFYENGDVHTTISDTLKPCYFIADDNVIDTICKLQHVRYDYKPMVRVVTEYDLTVHNFSSLRRFAKRDSAKSYFIPEGSDLLDLTPLESEEINTLTTVLETLGYDNLSNVHANETFFSFNNLAYRFTLPTDLLRRGFIKHLRVLGREIDFSVSFDALTLLLGTSFWFEYAHDTGFILTASEIPKHAKLNESGEYYIDLEDVL